MFAKKKLPVLTDTFCNEINLIVKIAEVTTGAGSHLKRYDFNTRKGQMLIAETVQEFFVDRIDPERVIFAFISTDISEDSDDYYKAYRWYAAHIEGNVVRVGETTHRDPSFRQGTMPMWWLGTSASNRWQKPVF